MWAASWWASTRQGSTRWRGAVLCCAVRCSAYRGNVAAACRAAAPSCLHCWQKRMALPLTSVMLCALAWLSAGRQGTQVRVRTCPQHINESGQAGGRQAGRSGNSRGLPARLLTADAQALVERAQAEQIIGAAIDLGRGRRVGSGRRSIKQPVAALCGGAVGGRRHMLAGACCGYDRRACS